MSIIKNPKVTKYTNRVGTHLKLDKDLKELAVKKAQIQEKDLSTIVEDALRDHLKQES